MTRLLLTSGWLVMAAVATQPASAHPPATPPAQPAEQTAHGCGCAHDKEPAEAAEQEAEPEADGLETIIDGHDVITGLMTFYRDPDTGAVHLELAADQIDQEFIYFTHTLDGPLEAGHFRGSFRDNAVFSIRRYFNRIEFVEENSGYYFDPDNPLSRAADANISPAVLGSAEIVAEDEQTGRILIKADDLFLTESLHQVSPSPRPNGNGDRFELGSLAKDRSKIADVHAYPDNVDVRVDYVYTNDKPKVRGSRAVTDPRSVTVSLQHTLIAMPENGFTPRIDDPRVGYFFTRVTDLTDHGPTPYRDLIDRWNLVKKDPEADLSEPVEPIVWWIENTTPHEYRDAIRKGALAWNEAFESAGFKNAIVVKEQPDDADWDAGDIRYNVLRWTSSPRPPFGGYGPNFVNPRTGQILGADIMLENVYVTNRLIFDELFDLAGRGLPVGPQLTGPDGAPQLTCSNGHQMQLTSLFGQTVLSAHQASADQKKRIVEESLMRLTLHEIGHTLGLNHNMRASQLHDLQTLGDRAATDGVVTGSVMDYPAINLALPDEPQGHYYDIRPGPYDHWAIAFGYDPDLEDAAKRTTLLNRSTEPELAFGNDADDLRSPGRGNDPRVMIGDMSDDAIGFALNQIALVEDTMGEIKARYAQPGQSWHELRNAYLVLTGIHNTAARVISRYVGGVHQDRAFTDQDGGDGQPFTPVAYEEQKRAMAALAEHLFAPDAFAAPEDLLNHLQQQRRGFDHFSRNEDPELHGRVLAIQGDILNHLLHPNTLRRITDSRLYGNDYAAADMIMDLSKAVFEADLDGAVNTQRQMLQIDYAKRLAKVAQDDKYDHVARSAALASLKQIERWMEQSGRPDLETRAHRDHVLFLVSAALDPSKRA